MECLVACCFPVSYTYGHFVQLTLSVSLGSLRPTLVSRTCSYTFVVERECEITPPHDLQSASLFQDNRKLGISIHHLLLSMTRHTTFLCYDT